MDPNSPEYREADKRATKTYEQLKNVKPIPKVKTVQEIAQERIADRQLEKIAPSTGFPDLDELIKGFIPNHLYTLTGETNVGKTAIACNFAVNVIKQHKRVLYLALEPGNNVVEYLASIIHSKQFGAITEEDLLFDNLQLDVLGKEDVESADQMVQIIESFDRYDLIIVDHIGYFITNESNYLQQQSNTVKKMVSLAKKKKCAIIIIAHLRKRAKNEKKSYTPSADDVSGSAAFKQDSTEVLIVTRQLMTTEKDEVRYTDQGKIVVAKTKAGPNGIVDITFSERSAKIFSNAGFNREDYPLVSAAKDIFGV